MIHLFHPYICRHCKTHYVILPGANKNSFLPVEVINGKEKECGVFDKTKHKSHLLNCAPLQAQWESVKKRIYQEQKLQEKADMKQLLK